jgi:hypothetical protein
VGTLTTPGSYTPISSGEWPLTITNSNPGAGSILRVVATNNLTFTSSYGNTSGYLITGSTYITFDGSGNTITLNGITGYPGFIQNGTNVAFGKANIVVQNFTTAVLNSSTLVASAGWLCQQYFGRSSLANSITGCTNNGVISASNCGGIVGINAGDAGVLTITNCTNSGVISASSAGGMLGFGGGANGGSVTFTNCTNSGLISGIQAGGIVGRSAGFSNGTCTITNCFSTGNITGQYSGGIAGSSFAINTNKLCSISNCYSTGNISGEIAGGIVGANVGSSSTSLYTGVVNITNSYSLGTIATTCGGICGGDIGLSYSNKANINITNSYSYGALSGTGAGLVAASLTSTNITLTTSNTYVAAGSWSDATANTNLTGDPLGVGIPNKGTTWTSISANTPYLLSSYWLLTNPTQIYTPNSVNSSTNFSSVAGSYSPGIYSIQSSSQVGSTITFNVDAIAGTSPIYYGYYNNNIYTFTNTNGSTGPITGTINTSNGVLDFIVPPPPTLTSITPFTSSSTLAVVTISYANLVTNGNEVVGNNPYVFLVNSVSSGSLSFGTTQGTATPWNASTNKTINASNNAYWSPPLGGVSGLFNAFSVVIQDSIGGLSSPNVDVQVSVPYPCFLEGTKILCFENNEEVYRPVESLQKGDLVKTIYNGYMPVCMMGTTSIYNPGNDYRVANRIYKCPREKYPTLFEDLYITGCHSILVPWMTNDQWENTKAVNGNIYVTDNHFRLIACADEKAEPFNKEGFMNIYHIALDHHDICMNYGIYANGLLVESCSIDFLIQYSNMKILAENSNVAYEDVGNVSNNMTRQLVDTC